MFPDSSHALGMLLLGVEAGGVGNVGDECKSGCGVTAGWDWEVAADLLLCAIEVAIGALLLGLDFGGDCSICDETGCTAGVIRADNAGVDR